MVYLEELIYLKTGVVPKVMASLRGFLTWPLALLRCFMGINSYIACIKST